MTSPTPTSPAMSYSQSNALGCGHFYKRHYIDGGRDLPEAGGVFLRGSLYHQIIAHYMNHLLGTGKDTDWDELYKIAARIGTGAPPDVKEDVAGLVELTREHFVKPPYCTPENTGIEKRIGIEEMEPGRFYPCDFDSPKAFFRMRIDLVTMLVELLKIRDYKTTWAIETESQAQKNRQMSWYAWGCSVLLPDVQLFEPELCYPRARFYCVPARFTRADLEGVPDEIRAYRQRREKLIEESEWDAREVKSLCTICSYECPLRGRDFTMPPNTRDKAVALADHLEWLVLETDKTRKNLKDYANEHGVVEASSGLCFGWYPIMSYELTDDARGIIQAADPEILLASASVIKKKLEAQSRAELRESLSEFKRPTTKTAFYGVIPKEEK